MQKIKTLLKLVVSVGGLIFVFSRVPFSDISKNWNLSVLPWLIPMLILTELGMLIQANRWKKMSIEGPEIPYRSYYAYIALGYFFNNLLPGGFGGDVVKSVAFGKRYGQTSQSVASILISRILGLLALFVLFLLRDPVFEPSKSNSFGLPCDDDLHVRIMHCGDRVMPLFGQVPFGHYFEACAVRGEVAEQSCHLPQA